MKKSIIILAITALMASGHIKAQEVKLIPGQLTLVDYFSTEASHRFAEDAPFSIDSLLSITMSTESFYNSLENKQISYIVADTVSHRKKDGVLRLPIGETYIELEDERGEGGVMYGNFYKGQIPFLNSYLILFTGNEFLYYFLIDKTTGEDSGYRFADYPFISPNKQYGVCIYANPYFSTAEMQIWKIAGDELDLLYSFNFVNWMPTTYTTSLRWIDDNSFVVKAIHPQSFWDEKGYENETGEYIKIEILQQK